MDLEGETQDIDKASQGGTLFNRSDSDYKRFATHREQMIKEEIVRAASILHRGNGSHVITPADVISNMDRTRFNGIDEEVFAGVMAVAMESYGESLINNLPVKRIAWVGLGPYANRARQELARYERDAYGLQERVESCSCGEHEKKVSSPMGFDTFTYASDTLDALLRTRYSLIVLPHEMYAGDQRALGGERIDCGDQRAILNYVISKIRSEGSPNENTSMLLLYHIRDDEVLDPSHYLRAGATAVLNTCEINHRPEGGQVHDHGQGEFVEMKFPAGKTTSWYDIMKEHIPSHAFFL